MRSRRVLVVAWCAWCAGALQAPPRRVAVGGRSADLAPARASLRDVTRATARFVWPRGAWGHKALGVSTLACLVVQKCLNVRVPFALQRAVDALGRGDGAEAARAARRAVAAYCGGRLAVSFAGEARSLCFSRVSQGSGRRFQRDVFGKLHALPSAWHRSHPTGEVSVSFARGERGFRSLLSLAVFSVAPTILELVLSVTVLRRRFASHAFGLIALGTFGLYAAWTAVLVDLRVARRRKLVRLDQRRGAVLVDSLANQESVKLYGNAFGEAARFDEILAATEQEAVTSQALGGLLNLGQALIFGAGLWAALSLAVAKHALDPAAFSVGDVVAVNALLLQLAVPMNFLGYTVSEIRQGLVDADAVVKAAKEADAEPAPPPPRHSAAPPAVAFRDVWVFRGGTTALRGASFEAVPGGVTALVGASGSGKSTALRILAGLEGPPDGGAVAADPGLTTMVAQDGVLFDDTVAYNVRYGRPGASDADVSEALAAVSLGDLDGASPVGERGAKLSGGERQRVLAARALLRPSNLLLLDESTSALDAPTEAAVLSALLDAKGRPRTALVVAHRLQAITPRADSVVVFDGGRVVAQGNHPDLLATCPEYQALWRADDDAAAAHAP